MSVDTRRESFDVTQIELAERQREVYDLIAASHEGLTAWDIAEYTHHFVHTVRPRITELVKLHLLERGGERWHEATHRHEAVWRLAQPHGQMDLL